MHLVNELSVVRLLPGKKKIEPLPLNRQKKIEPLPLSRRKKNRVVVIEQAERKKKLGQATMPYTLQKKVRSLDNRGLKYKTISRQRDWEFFFLVSH